MFRSQLPSFGRFIHLASKSFCNAAFPGSGPQATTPGYANRATASPHTGFPNPNPDNNPLFFNKLEQWIEVFACIRFAGGPSGTFVSHFVARF